MFHVGDVVRKLREQRGWTVKALGTKAGINKMTVSSIENGGNYTRDSLQKIAQALGQSVAQLEATLHTWAEAVAHPFALTDEQRAVLDAWAGLEEEGRTAHLQELRREARLVARARADTGTASAHAPASQTRPTAIRRRRAR